jgi:anti-anti-sigma factor
MAEPRTTFEVDAEAGELRCSGNLDFRVERAFEQACNELLMATGGTLALDLRLTKYICSSCLGMLFLMHERAKMRGQHVRVRINKVAAPICRMMGLEQLVDLEVVD